MTQECVSQAFIQNSGVPNVCNAKMNCSLFLTKDTLVHVMDGDVLVIVSLQLDTHTGHVTYM